MSTVSLLTDDDLYLFNEGTHGRMYEKLGAHPETDNATAGTRFGVWAPNAERVHVMGDFNGWSKDANPLFPRGVSGIWEGTLPGVQAGMRYKYYIESRHGNYRVDKTDPYAFHNEVAPQTASIVCNLDYAWRDEHWMRHRGQYQGLDKPISIYEVHLGSWMRRDDGDYLGYREAAERLVEYVVRMNFTHVEFLPLMEHPFYGSWGYQTTGYFAPTSRYGAPTELMHLIDRLHQRGVGVILDWVPSHFTTDEHGLGYFDGTYLYEHSDTRQRVHPDWNSFVFNHGRNEVRSFLLSSALFWFDKYHIDGLRVDAVASMLYLDYSRKEGQWVPNRYGGRENLDAIDFLRQLNETVYENYPDTLTVAEESTSWPMVSRPTYIGGLGFGYKWDMGWMHDTLQYMAHDPLFRKYHHNEVTFRMMYAFAENFVLPLSHDEVVHGKGSLLAKMPGDDWRKFANLRLLLGYMFTQPGKKLLFMGGEFGQWREWNHDEALDWNLLEYDSHRSLQRWVEDLNRTYREQPTLHLHDCREEGFQWVDCNDSEDSVLTFLRFGTGEHRPMVVACNFTPQPRPNYKVGVPYDGLWREILNSDAPLYGGSGWGNMGGVEASPVPAHGRDASLNLTLPPLGIVVLQADEPVEEIGP